MTEAAARSAGARRCRFAVAAVFCALAVGPGCGRETFDLLNVAGNAAIAGSAGAAQAGAGMSGAPNALAGGGSGRAGGGNGNEPDAGAGRAGISHGGFGAGAGFGQAGFGGGSPGCLPGQPCVNGDWPCQSTMSLCVHCDSNADCHAYPALQNCSPASGRCVECLDNNDCVNDTVCDQFTSRCAHRCQTSPDCTTDVGYPVCNPQLGACVECAKDANCPAIGGRQTYCAQGGFGFGSCVECTHSNADAATPAAVQCPLEKPYCFGFHCQGKSH